MNRGKRLGLALIFFMPWLGSCAWLPFQPVAPGEVRLTRLEVPETVQEDMTYDVALSFRSDSTPMIRQVCCRWASLVPSVAHSSMYWYNYEASSDEPMGSARSRWLDEGAYYDFSGPLCAEEDAIRAISQDRVIVRLQARELKPHFNALECYMEYMNNGRLMESNRVRARVDTSTSP
ncbi:MAG: hypothetical protein MUF52_14130 [Syntrophobacteraceae bacterium]|jgi:hypothetical protein|nr:hypothetical protein [Syntrophobacteraceae bacterium]